MGGSLRRQRAVQWMGPRQVWIPTWPDSGSLGDAWRGLGSSCRVRLCSAEFCTELLRVECGFLSGRGVGDLESSRRGRAWEFDVLTRLAAWMCRAALGTAWFGKVTQQS